MTPPTFTLPASILHFQWLAEENRKQPPSLAVFMTADLGKASKAICLRNLYIAALWCASSSFWKRGMTSIHHSITTTKNKNQVDKWNNIAFYVWGRKNMLPRTKIYSSNTLATMTLGYVTLSLSACICFMITEQTTASLEGATQTHFPFDHWNKTDSKASESCIWILWYRSREDVNNMALCLCWIFF